MNIELERRRAPRLRHSAPLWWREEGGTAFSMGWALDKSASGSAFALRSLDRPCAGDLIRVSSEDPDSTGATPRYAVVQRVEAPHGDLMIIGVEFVGMPRERNQGASAVESKHVSLRPLLEGATFRCLLRRVPAAA